MAEKKWNVRDLFRILVWIVLLTFLIYGIIQRCILGYDRLHFSPLIYGLSLMLSTVFVYTVYYSKPVQEFLTDFLIPATFGFGAGLLVSMLVQKAFLSDPDFRFWHASFVLPSLLVGGFFVYGRYHRPIKERFNPYKPCPVCGESAKESVLSTKSPKRYFCRTHLLDEVEQAILSATAKMVVFDPKLKNQDTFFTYDFYPMKRLSKKWRTLAKTIQAGLDMIDGPCGECGLSAHVAYYDKSSSKCYPDSDIPNYEELFCKPRVLCRSCAARHIRYALAEYAHIFEYPLHMPCHTEGAMFSYAW